MTLPSGKGQEEALKLHPSLGQGVKIVDPEDNAEINGIPQKVKGQELSCCAICNPPSGPQENLVESKDAR